MRKYFINNTEVTKEDWSKEFSNNPSASVVLRINRLPLPYKSPQSDQPPITPEKARQINKLTKLKFN